MGKNFYSGTDADLAAGSTNLVTIVTPAVATYGVTAGQMTSYSALATSYNNLYDIAVTPATRTPVAISNKNQARRLLKAATVNLARIFTATETVTNGMLLALRMNERVVPTPRPVPQVAPVVEVISVSGRLVKGRVHDATSDRRGLPFGAVGANIYSFVGAVAPTDPRDYHFEGMTTRASMEILFPDTVPSGSTVWLSACWVSARGQTSMGSTPMSFTLQGGAISAAA